MIKEKFIKSAISAFAMVAATTLLGCKDTELDNNTTITTAKQSIRNLLIDEFNVRSEKYGEGIIGYHMTSTRDGGRVDISILDTTSPTGISKPEACANAIVNDKQVIVCVSSTDLGAEPAQNSLLALRN